MVQQSIVSDLELVLIVCVAPATYQCFYYNNQPKSIHNWNHVYSKFVPTKVGQKLRQIVILSSQIGLTTSTDTIY